MRPSGTLLLEQPRSVARALSALGYGSAPAASSGGAKYLRSNIEYVNSPQGEAQFTTFARSSRDRGLRLVAIFVDPGTDGHELGLCEVYINDKREIVFTSTFNANDKLKAEVLAEYKRRLETERDTGRLGAAWGVDDVAGINTRIQGKLAKRKEVYGRPDFLLFDSVSAAELAAGKGVLRRRCVAEKARRVKSVLLDVNIINKLNNLLCFDSPGGGEEDEDGGAWLTTARKKWKSIYDAPNNLVSIDDLQLLLVACNDRGSSAHPQRVLAGIHARSLIAPVIRDAYAASPELVAASSNAVVHKAASGRAVAATSVHRLLLKAGVSFDSKGKALNCAVAVFVGDYGAAQNKTRGKKHKKHSDPMTASYVVVNGVIDVVGANNVCALLVDEWHSSAFSAGSHSRFSDVPVRRVHKKKLRKAMKRWYADVGGDGMLDAAATAAEKASDTRAVAAVDKARNPGYTGLTRKEKRLIKRSKERALKTYLDSNTEEVSWSSLFESSPWRLKAVAVGAESGCPRGGKRVCPCHAALAENKDVFGTQHHPAKAAGTGSSTDESESEALYMFFIQRDKAACKAMRVIVEQALGIKDEVAVFKRPNN